MKIKTIYGTMDSQRGACEITVSAAAAKEVAARSPRGLDILATLRSKARDHQDHSVRVYGPRVGDEFPLLGEWEVDSDRDSAGR